MKLTRIELWTDNQESFIPLDFNDPRGTSQYFIKDASGLDADEISAQFYGAGSKNYRNLKVAKRTVVLKIGLRPNFSLNENFGISRDKLYKFVASNRSGQVQLHFMNQNVEVARLNGYISKIDSAQFSKSQEMSISIDCINPMLVSPSISGIPVVGLDPANFVINDDLSTAPHGCTIWFDVTTPTPKITIRDPLSDWFFQLHRLVGFTTNDLVIINSDPNNRAATLIRGSTFFNIADSIIPGSIWPVIFPGQNNFSVDEAVNLSLINFNFFATYWGV